ncbi:MFS transporter [Chelatococcus sp. SYSU_G07232]|uniref:MFS transporter n=1 Tax=Chelatococcus albus TaxID=3047466 RepID=A0ABT7AD00_9HYPH|nr:MFS transporter [Chelatococcus sp. SYSU_G07232]MDJ1156699.1 MFS transporter [Chelatococcus sp. SYSU_G07232]
MTAETSSPQPGAATAAASQSGTAASEAPPATWRGIPRGIWVLGFVSLFMDVSSEMIHALLPIYLVTVLGTSMLTVGIIEGIAEATALVTKVVSGGISDWLGKRKLLTVVGYGLAALTKPVFPLAPTVGWLVAARFVDRIGKGIRGAPRDALIADLAPPGLRGASFGLRQTLDTIGAFLGPLAAIALMAATAGHFTLVFWVAVVPAVLAVALLVFGIREPERHAAAPARPRLRLADMRYLPAAFWRVVAVAGVLTLARFSEAFLLLRAQSVGLQPSLVPAVLVVMNVVYALAAYPAGVMSDRVGRRGVLVAGIFMLIVADLILALSTGLAGVTLGIAFWGLHMGFTQGLLATLVADTAPVHLRGTAFGLFNLAGGIAMLAASVIAGALWDAQGPQATFLAGAVFTILALVGFVLVGRRATAFPAK